MFSDEENQSIYLIGEGDCFILKRQGISLQNFPSASSSVVPGIVKMDANKNYSLLDDPQNVFPSPQYVRNVMGSPDGNTLFILTSTGDVYSWDTLNYYQLVYSNSSLQSPLLVDSSNNVYLLGANITFTHQQGYTNSYFLIFLNASESYQRIPSPFHPSSLPSSLILSFPSSLFPSFPFSSPSRPKTFSNFFTHFLEASAFRYDS